MIPVEAPPTILGDRIRTKWTIKAVINKRLWKDIVTKKEFTVATFVRGPEYTSPQNISKQFGNVTVNLSLPRISFVPGEVISGVLNITSNDYVKFNEVRASFELVEFISPQIISAIGVQRIVDSQTTFKKEFSKTKIAKDVEILTMGTSQLPINLQVPQVQVPSFQTSLFSTQWILKITLSRRLKTDFNLEIPILVTNGIF